ncbi:cache domain-containing sensor histidine kinase [Cohnella silvisoli]|uniref:Histidine kinase n=1 Tax=Cohnella silvisoli TaxID=2873699 RepID=A0ABV1KMI8_9BACL|nr:histidine kinase [Cohnella silvisoli]MCD9020642.1 histidine kinase [Cohnella silvisoli]
MIARIKRFKTSIMLQLTVSFFVIILLILSLAMGLIYNRVLDIVKVNMEKSTVQALNQTEAGIMQFRDEVEKVSRGIIINSDLQHLMENYGTMTQVERIEHIRPILEHLSQILGNYSFLHSIYIFIEDGQIIEVTNGKATISDNILFQENPVYQKTKLAFPKLVWFGGQSKDEYAVQRSGEDKDQIPNLVTAARGIKSLNVKPQAGTLLLNIRQESIATIFNQLVDSEKSRIYMEEVGGAIIAGDQTEMLGRKTDYFSNIPEDKSYGSFTVKEKDGPVQVIYKKIGQTGWTMVKEIPFEEFVSVTRSIRFIIAIIFGVSLILSLLLFVYWVRRLTSPVQELAAVMRGVERGCFDVRIQSPANNEFGLLGRQFNRMSQSIEDLLQQNQEIAQQKMKQEMIALQAHINPHFLYNTLNTIKSMSIMAQNHSITETVTALGLLLQGIFRNSSAFCSLREEMDFVQTYVKIMNIRYGEQLKLQLTIPDEMLNAPILRFLFQPLIENAVMHGFDGQNDMQIMIGGRFVDVGMELWVRNNGIPLNREVMEWINNTLRNEMFDQERGAYADNYRIGVGLRNVNQRIRLNYGADYGLWLESGEDGETTAIIRVGSVQNS